MSPNKERLGEKARFNLEVRVQAGVMLIRIETKYGQQRVLMSIPEYKVDCLGRGVLCHALARVKKGDNIRLVFRSCSFHPCILRSCHRVASWAIPKSIYLSSKEL